MVRAVLIDQSTVSGFDLAWFSSLSSEHLSLFRLYGAIHIYIFSLLFLLVSWVW